MNSVSLKSGITVVIAKDNSSHCPIFSEVKEVFTLSNRILLGIQMMEVLQYNHHYHSWEVKYTDKLRIVDFSILASHQVLMARPSPLFMGVIKFVTLKFAVF